MTYLLDTNVAVALLRDRPVVVRHAFRRVVAERSTVAVSSLTIFELWYGVRRSDRPVVNATRVRLFLSGGLQRLAFDDEDAVVAGRLRAELAARNADRSVRCADRRPGVEPRSNLGDSQRVRVRTVPDLDWRDWSAEDPSRREEDLPRAQ